MNTNLMELHEAHKQRRMRMGIPCAQAPTVRIVSQSQNAPNHDAHVIKYRSRLEGLPTNLSATVIIGACAKHFRIPTHEMMSVSRSTPILRARWVAIYLIHHIKKGSLHSTARVFNKDHTTVVYAVKKVSDLISGGDPIQSDIDEIVVLLHHRVRSQS